MNPGPKKQLGIIWLHKDGFDLRIDSNPNIYKFNFTQDSVLYLDVIDEEKLTQQITGFISHNKIPGSDFLMVLGQDFVFEQQILVKEINQIEAVKQHFLDTVPYENVYSKIWPTSQGSRIIAFNYDLFQTIKEAFAALDFTVDVVIPYFLCEQTSLNAINIVSLLKKRDVLKQENIITHYTTNAVIYPGQPDENPPLKKNATLIWTLPVFGIMIFILLFMLLNTPKEKPLVKAKNRLFPTVTIKPNIEINPSITPIVNQASNSGQILPRNFDSSQAASLKVEIRIALDPQSNIESIKTELNKMNIKNITVKNDLSINQQIKTLIIFSRQVNPSLRSQLIEVLKPFFVEISAQENISSSQDVLIISGKQNL